MNLSFLDPVLIVLLALCLDLAFGDPAWLYRLIWHPVVFMGKAIEIAERLLLRSGFSRGLKIALGALAVLLCLGLAILVGLLVQGLSNVPFGWIVQVLLAWSLLAFKGLYDFIKPVHLALVSGDLKAARLAVSHIVGRDPDQLDQAGVSRASIESLAENYSDGGVAPLFWFVVLGFPGLLAYKMINTLDSMIGHRNDRYEAFGKVAARLDDLVNWIPARLTALLFVLAQWLRFGRNPWASLGLVWREAGKHRSVNAGWPEAAMAAALDVKLAGPRDYGTYQVDDDWIGQGSTDAGHAELQRAFQLYWIANLLLVFGTAALVVA